MTVASRASKQHPDRLPENRAPADHYGMLSRWINVIGIKKSHDARRCARDEPGKPKRHGCEGVLGHPVDVFMRSDRLKCRPFVNRRGDGMLEENAIDPVVYREFFDGGDDLVGCRGSRGARSSMESTPTRSHRPCFILT